jgi:hypothetical protein
VDAVAGESPLANSAGYAFAITMADVFTFSLATTATK